MELSEVSVVLQVMNNSTLLIPVTKKTLVKSSKLLSPQTVLSHRW